MLEPHTDGQVDSEPTSTKSPEIIIHQHDREIWVVVTEQQRVTTKLEFEDPRVAEQIRGRQKKAADEPSAFTWRKTIEQSDWSNYLWEFVQDFLVNDPIGQQLLKEATVSNLQELTPAQAIYLSTALVSALKNYDQQHIIDQPNVDLLIMKGHLRHSSYAPDNMTVLEVLLLGKQLKQNGTKESSSDSLTGNGVCRNFADAVSAVYEAIKSNQYPNNYLHHTYCLRESGDETYFEPKYQELNPSTLSLSRSGHVWNRFITIENDKELQTVVDSTWSRLDSNSGKLSQFDYSFKRSFKPLLEDCRKEFLTNPSMERKQQIIADMFALTDKALKEVQVSEVVMDDELRVYLHGFPQFYETVNDWQQKNGLDLETATVRVEELYRLAMTKEQKEPQAAFYVHSLIMEIYRNTELLSAEQRQKLKSWILVYFPQDTGISLEVLLKTGATPHELQERMAEFIPRAAEDKITRSLVLNNPWLQAWIYGLGNENTFEQLERSDSFSNYNVWHLKPAIWREHQPGEAFYDTANEFWYDLWRGLIKRSDIVSSGETRIVSYPSETLKLWLDILAYVWNRESMQRYKAFTSPRRPLGMDRDRLKKVFTFTETKELLDTFIEEGRKNIDEGKQTELTFFSGDKKQITDALLNKASHLLRVLDKAATTTNRMETF